MTAFYRRGGSPRRQALYIVFEFSGADCRIPALNGMTKWGRVPKENGKLKPNRYNFPATPVKMKSPRGKPRGITPAKPEEMLLIEYAIHYFNR